MPNREPIPPGLLRLHADARHRLSTWGAPTPDQDRLRAAYLEHLRVHPDALWRSGPPAHLTASLLILDPPAEHVLLTLHAKAQRWFQMGGHIEPTDVDLPHAALREALEETGLSELTLLPGPVHLDRHTLSGAFGSCREHLDVRYAAVATGDLGATVSAESTDVRWFPVDALPGGADADVAPLVAAALAAMAR